MEFIYDDGGRAAAGYKGMCGDCVARSIAIAAERPYTEVYTALSDVQAQQRVNRKKQRRSARNGINTTSAAFKRYMASIGWIWTPTMYIGSGCKVHLRDGELPMGRLVVAVSKHYTAVIDGVVHDTYDPQRDLHCIDRFPGWETAELKPGQTRNQNGICSIRSRCVYGYWSKASA